MCGIFCSIYKNTDAKLFVADLLKQSGELLFNRGPDVQGCNHVDLSDDAGVILSGFTLHLRGRDPTTQPIVDSNGNMLLWNGEVFDGIKIAENENDGQILLNHLSKCTSDLCLLEILGKINGPFSLVYWQASSKKLWFGRDVLGKRSLLASISETYFIVSSVTSESETKWKEIPASGIYCLDMSGISDQKESLKNNKKELGCDEDDDEFTSHITLYPWLWKCLNGGSKVVSNWSEIELFNFNHSNWFFKSISLSNHGIMCSFCKLNPHHGHDDEIPTLNLRECTLSDFASDARQKAADQLLSLLCESVKKRVQSSSVPSQCSHCFIKRHRQENGDSHALVSSLESNFHETRICNHAKVAVLFSGGIDSLILAAVADRYIAPDDPIDLLNVSFVDLNKNKQQAPDRLTGIQGWDGLKSINPKRKWNFVEINVTLKELQEKRENRIKHLIKPCDTVLDDSIGCAIWFAARGQGQLKSHDDDHEAGNVAVPDEVYDSSARVTLLGTGADELFAGYSRHRMRFMNQGWEGLHRELELEIKNISSRNLGRDDRILSDHSKEARFPYLDDQLIDFVLSLEMDIKFDLKLPRGIGEKLLLRLVASNLGLSRGASLHKRAIQFGSRIAKLESRNEKANQKCSRLKSLKGGC